jgi:exonuclease III
MRLLSWNIRGGKHPGVVDSAIALEADVAVLVDCKATHAKRLIDEAAVYGYNHHLESQLGYTGIVMISRQPLIRGETAQDRAPHRWLHARSRHFELDIAAVYGPLPKTIGQEPPMSEFWEWVMTACDLIVDRSAVLCGDFNTGVDGVDGPLNYGFRGSNPFSELETRGWRDAYRELHPDGEERSWRSKERGFRIDHCMLSRTQSRPSRVEYVWNTSGTASDGPRLSSAKAPALPDHAVLVIDL